MRIQRGTEVEHILVQVDVEMEATCNRDNT